MVTQHVCGVRSAVMVLLLLDKTFWDSVCISILATESQNSSGWERSQEVSGSQLLKAGSSMRSKPSNLVLKIQGWTLH